MPIDAKDYTSALPERREYSWTSGNHYVYGDQELTYDEMHFFKDFQHTQVHRHSSFFAGPYADTLESQKQVIQTFEWLNQNIQGPWHLQNYPYPGQEGMICGVHIERFDQRENFLQAECNQFLHRNDFRSLEVSHPDKVEFYKQQEISELAIFKGLAEPYSAKEDLEIWLKEHQGIYKQTTMGAVWDTMNLTITHPAIEENFKKWENLNRFFKRDENSSVEKEGVKYFCYNKEYAYMHWFSEWERNAVALTHKRDEDRNHEISFRYPDIEEKFKNNWGDYFTYNDKYKTYHCAKENWPDLPARDVPPQFIQYLYGQAPDPSLK